MLPERLAAYVTYFEHLASQPPNRWEGFALPAHDERIYGLRFQLAFACYALGAIARHTEIEFEERMRCHEAMYALIVRMLQRRVWAYWALPAEHTERGTEPIDAPNLTYSAHLAMMIGVYKISGGDTRFDEPFTLHWSSRERFHYTFTTLVEALWRALRASPINAMPSFSGRIDPYTMGHALWALRMHDTLFATSYSNDTTRWLKFLAKRMAIGGPALSGRRAFSSTYLTGLRTPVGTSDNLSDAWSLAFLVALDEPLARRRAKRFLPAIRRLPTTGTGARAFTPVSGRRARNEWSDTALASGFSYLLALELGDTALADALLAYADTEFQPVSDALGRRYTKPKATVFTTALFALGEAGGVGRMRNAE